eukprot:TRINITY_DN2118_c0_g5_i2.p1 TRINITY_DN2118_c0_g5~~TRINITY_DN2118_c0_g5_i2.p1  ORF type:complete len:598 (+),score=104.06 TRINITY_DN2118_c0_g5_i2:138-1796(+)
MERGESGATAVPAAAGEGAQVGPAAVHNWGRTGLCAVLLAAIALAVPFAHRLARRRQWHGRRAAARRRRVGGELAESSPQAGAGLAWPMGNRTRRPPREELLGHSGERCTQQPSCGFFSDVLVLLHINPQRFEWVDPLVQLNTRFLPHLVLFSLIHPRSIARNVSAWSKVHFAGYPEEAIPEAERNRVLDVLYIGPRRTRVWLVDSRGQSQGDHHEVTVAHRLWPDYRGYLSWQDDDALVSWWTMAAADRGLDKNAFWALPSQGRDGRDLGACRRGQRCKRPAMRVRRGRGGHTNTWIQDQQFLKPLAELAKVQERLAKAQSFPDPGFLRLHNGMAFMYYVPAAAVPLWANISAPMLEEGMFLEFATPTMLNAVAGRLDRTVQTLAADNYVPHLCGPGQTCRYHYREQFDSLQHSRRDFLHPSRVCGELHARLVHWTERRQAAELAQVNGTATRLAFWSECFHCREYPEALWRQKGRFHTCVPGCSGNRSRVQPGRDWGSVLPADSPKAMPHAELPSEGFWTYEVVLKVFKRYGLVNGSTTFFTPPSDTMRD